MADPAHSRRHYLLAVGLIFAAAAFLRFHQIDRRPFHADEGVQAYQTWRLLRGDGYTYDPADKHGPFLYYTAAGLAKILGWTPAALSEAKLRSVTLLAGLGTLALLLGAGARLGRAAVLVGAAIVAVSPLTVLYDTYFVQEAWFCFLTWALFFAALRWWEQPTLLLALLVGTLAGLMQATKETSVLHFAALAVPLFAFRWVSKPRGATAGGTRPPDGFSPTDKKTTRPVAGLHLLLVVLAAAAVYVVFYSACFTRWAGVADGLRAYFTYAARASGGVHDHPAWYYLGILWPHSQGGVPWGEPLLLVLALVGLVLGFAPGASPGHRSVALFTAALMTIYSFIPYKTPWLLLTPFVGLALLAGVATVRSAGWIPAKPVWLVSGLLGLLLVAEGAWRGNAALGRYANDDRNPYVYQPTSPDLPRLVAAIAAQPAGTKVAVVSPDHAWPLPWYLRDRAVTGYFATPPGNPAAYDLILLDSRLEAPPPSSAPAFGLRPNVLLWQVTR